MDAVGSALDRFLERLPAFDSDWPIAEAVRTLAEYAVLAWELFPPIKTVLLVLAAYVAVELVLIAWYWINWLIKKIPGLS